MYAQAAIKSNTLLRNGAYGIVMRGVQKCTRGCSSLRGRNRLPLCCIKLDTATEPSCGIGNFFSRKPEDMDLQFYGVEIDPLSGKMAQALYPEADIQIKGYEEAALPDHSFDVAIGNVPFGDYQVQNPQYDRLHFLIHDYFFAKTIDKLRPGGILAFITSTGTMDKADTRLREHLARHCDLLGGVDYPTTPSQKKPEPRSIPIFCSFRSGIRSVKKKNYPTG